MLEVFDIKPHTKPHLGKIIKELREHKGMSQDDLARITFLNRSMLSQIELGNKNCPDDVLSVIKAALGLENLPLCQMERSNFKDRLYKWYSVISERNLNQAKELKEKLSIIRLVPHDRELNILFSLFECRLLLGLKELTEAKKILDEFEANIDELSDIHLYHYHYNQGTYFVRSAQNQTALDCYLKAYELMKCGLEKNLPLYFNIAICYERLGKISLSTTFLEAARRLHSEGNNTVPAFSLYSFLGANYARAGNLQISKFLLDKAYTIALNNYETNANENTEIDLCIVLVNMGYMFRLAKRWNMAIECLDKAMQHIAKETTHYLEAVYQKVRCLIEMRTPLFCTNLLAEGALLSKGDETYTVLFDALSCLINPTENSVKKLELKILPYLLENNCYILALEYSKFIRDYYKSRRGFKTKALNMSDIICTILHHVYEGGVIE